MRTTSSEMALRATRAVLRSVRLVRMVSRSVFLTIASFTFWWIAASWVAMKRVPMLTPSAPSASAATSERPSAMPPEAITGMFTASTVAGSSTISVTSSSPGWPAHSKPSMQITSTPSRAAVTRVADRGALVDHLDAGGLEVRQVVDRAAARGLDDLDAALDDRLAIVVVGDRVQRRQQRQVHAERLVGELAGLLDLRLQLLGGREQVGDDEAQRAGVGHRGHQLAVADAGHAAHHDRRLDAEHLGDAWS